MSNAPRRALAAGTILAVASFGLVLLDPESAEAASPSVTVSAGPVDPVGGPYSERYGRDAAARPAGATYWLTIDPSWVEVEYTLVGGSGGGVAYHSGGLGARIDGEITPSGQTYLIVPARRGQGTTAGSSPAGFAGGTGAAGSGLETNTGFAPDRDYRDGAGGGGGSYLAEVPAVDELIGRTLFAVAGGGGGAASGDGYAETPFGDPVCRGAAGGNAGSPGASSVRYERPAAGAFGPLVMCVAAAGGRSGSQLGLGYSTHLKHADALGYGPGAGGGGGGLDAGEAGRGIEAEILQGDNLTPAGGAAGGGGGGTSLVSPGARLALDDGRGDGYSEIRWYAPHETTLSAQVAAGAVVASGRAIPFALDFGVPANGVPAVAAGGTITATLDGEPVLLPGTSTAATGSIADGIALVLPAIVDGPKTLCFSLAPTSAQLLPPAPACLPLEVPRTTIQAGLVAPPSLTVGTHPDCPIAGCVELPATANGPALHPVLRPAAGVDLAALPAEPLQLTLTYRDLATGVTAAPQSMTVTRATAPAGQPAGLLPVLADGSVPLSYLDFPVPKISGKVYELRIAVADSAYFSYADSPPLYIRVVPSPAPVTLTVSTDPIETGQQIDLTAVIAGTAGPDLPLCCGASRPIVIHSAPGGAFSVTVERATAPSVPLAGYDLGALPFNQSQRTGTIPAPADAGDYRLVLRFTSTDSRYGDQATSRDIVVVKAATATTLELRPASAAAYGTAWVLESSTTLTGAGSGSPAGDVEFEIVDAASTLVWSGSGTLDPATGLTSVALGPDTRLLIPGDYRVTASYGGDAGRQPSVGTANLTIDPAGVGMALTAPDTVEYGGTLPWSSVVTADPVDGSLLAPPGATVAWELVQGASSHASGITAASETSVDSMSATFRGDIDVSSLEPGDYTLETGFVGDASHAPAAVSRDMSIVARQTAVALTAPASAGYGQTSELRVTATSTLAGLTPTGDVVFRATAADGSTHGLGTAVLSAGTASLLTDPTALAWLVPGDYTVDACLQGSTRFAGSCSVAALTVERAVVEVAVRAASSVIYGAELGVVVDVTWAATAAPDGWRPAIAPTLGIAASGDTAAGVRGGLTLREWAPGLARYGVDLATAGSIFPGAARLGAVLPGDRFFLPGTAATTLTVERMPAIVEVRFETVEGAGSAIATVAGSFPTLGAPTGEVAFRVGSLERGALELGTVTLDQAGRAALALDAARIAGTDLVVTATYGGSAVHRDGSARVDIPRSAIVQLTTNASDGAASGTGTSASDVPDAADEGRSGTEGAVVAAVVFGVIALVAALALLILLLRGRRRGAEATG